MPKKSTYTFSETDTAAIKQARKANKDKRIERRLAVLEMASLGKEAREIASATGFHKDYVYKLTAKFRKGGLEAVTGNHYHGNRRNMGAAEEAGILRPFLEAAGKGQVIGVFEIKAAYEKACGHAIGSGQIYPVFIVK